MSKALSELRKIPSRLMGFWRQVKSFFIQQPKQSEEPVDTDAMDIIRKTINDMSERIPRYEEKRRQLAEKYEKYKADYGKAPTPAQKKLLAQSLQNVKSYEQLIDKQKTRIKQLDATAKKLEEAQQAKTAAMTKRFPIATQINKAQAELNELQNKEKAANAKVKLWQGYAAESAQDFSSSKHQTNLSGLKLAKEELQEVEKEIKVKEAVIALLKESKTKELANQKLATGLASQQPQATNSPQGSLPPPPRNYQGQNGRSRPNRGPN